MNLCGGGGGLKRSINRDERERSINERDSKK